MKTIGQPPLHTTDGLPPASQNGARINRQDKQDQTKKVSKTNRRCQFKTRERSMSSGSTRGAFGPHPTPKGEPPVTQVTLSRNNTKKNRGNTNDNTFHDLTNVSNELYSKDNLGSIAALAIENERQGLPVSRKDRQPRNTNQVIEVLNHTPLPPHPNSCDNDSPGSVVGAFPKRVGPGDKREEKINGSQGPNFIDRRNFLANRDDSEHLTDFGISQTSLGTEGDFSPRKKWMNSTCRYSTSDSLLNGEMLKVSAVSVSCYSNDAPSSCLDGAKVDNYGGMGSTNNCGRSIPASHVDSTFDYNTHKSDESDDEPKSWRDYLYCEFVFNSEKPDFSTLQQSFWAVVIGVIMGVATAIWGGVIEFCVEFVWKTVPEYLYTKGVFTHLDGHLPLPHYMWMCPGLFGGVLSYICAVRTIPGQNEWIESLHSIGIMDQSSIVPTLLISTAGMASGLSLGPELPLVLTGGMVGSYLGHKFKQSILSVRVMNLTGASAAVAGFFGFPMAGALFVLELPHRMGLQYFEALSPATLASIFAVLVNRIVTGDEVKGYFEYPQLSETLPSYMFGIAFAYAFVGLSVGIGYTEGCLFLKKWVQDLFNLHHDDNKKPQYDADIKYAHQTEDEPLFRGSKRVQSERESESDDKSYLSESRFSNNLERFGISNEPTRAAVVGALAGAVVGVICMFVPHNLFWGEAQLQTLIDRGRTPLPVFGYDDDEPTALLTAYGYCLINPEDDNTSAGFGTACAGVITITKVLVIGLSLGTGIIGGHFWGPLFVGCAASHFFIDICDLCSGTFGFGSTISDYPCVAMLCIMGSAHVVTFRANMAIMLILTLSIKSFTAEFSNGVSGDYSAIFPLLVVACFLSLQASKSFTTFYKQQRCRGDITAIAQVLCEANPDGSRSYEEDDDDYNDDGLEWKSTESTSTSYNNFVGGSQFTMGNMSLDASDMGFDDRADGSSGVVHYDSQGTPSVSSKEGSIAKQEPKGQERGFTHKQPLVPNSQEHNQGSPFGVYKGNPFGVSKQRTGQISQERNQGSSFGVSSLNIDSSEKKSGAQVQGRPTHRRAKSGGACMTNLTTSTISRMQYMKSDSEREIKMNEIVGFRSGASVCSVRSSGRIEDFSPSLLDQGRKSSETRSRSNTPHRFGSNGSTRSRSNTPQRNCPR